MTVEREYARLELGGAAANLEFEEAARLRDEIKRMKLMDLEFANDILTNEGEQVDKAAPKKWRAEAMLKGGGRPEATVKLMSLAL